MTAEAGARYAALQRVTQAASAAAVLVGSLVMIGWMLGSGPLKSVLPDLVTMKPNTAIALLLSGISLWVLRDERAGQRARRAALTYALAVSLVGLLTLCEYLLYLNLGIDQLLFQEPSGAASTSHPGRMAPTSALCFLLLGSALLVLDSGKWFGLAQLFTLLSLSVSVLALVGYAYGVTSLYGMSHFTAMALHTAATIAILCVGILFARPDRGLMSIAISNTAGGHMLRRLLPAAVGVSFLLGWLRLQGQRAGFYDTEFGVAIFTLLTIIVLTVLISWNARVLHHLDGKRRRAEDALRQAHGDLERRVEERTTELATVNEAMQTEIKVRRELEDVLRGSEARKRAILESAFDCIIAMDHEGRVVEFNPAAERTFGYRADEALGKEMANLIIPPAMRKRHREGLAHYLTTGEGPVIGKRIEIAGMRSDGSEFPTELAITTSVVAGNPVFTACLRDITARKLGEEESTRRAEELARSNSELQQFAYVASHDLQEPLRTVSSYVQLLESRYKDSFDGESAEFLAFIVEGAERMQRLVRDLLTYSRVGTHGKGYLPTDFNRLFIEAVKNLEAAIEESGATVTSDPLPTARVDDVQMIQVIQNLIANAIKFRGGQPPRVHVSAEEMPNALLFTVRDNGIGFSQEYADRIFVIFKRLNKRQLYQGTGIGLAICKKIVERHGGRIWAESVPGKGSTFFFSIPKMHSEAAAFTEVHIRDEVHTSYAG